MKEERMIQYIPTEAEEQKVLMSWATLYSQRGFPELSLLYHIPNGGKRNKSTAGKLRAEGVKPGVPDLCLPVARNGYYGLYIELKRTVRGKTSKEQEHWIRALTEQGYRCAVCRGWEEAKAELCKYLEIPQGER